MDSIEMEIYDVTNSTENFISRALILVLNKLKVERKKMYTYFSMLSTKAVATKRHLVYVYFVFYYFLRYFF